MTETPAHEILPAIAAVLNADSALGDTYGITAAYTVEAPATAALPYVEVTFNSPAVPDYVLGNDRSRAVHLVTVKVIATGSAAQARTTRDYIAGLLKQSPPEYGTGELFVFRPYSGIDYAEVDGANRYYHVGDVYRVETS